jgi:hypothetical protein
MTNAETDAKLAEAISERMKGFEPALIATGFHRFNPGAGAGLILAAPDCIVFTYSPDSGLFLDWTLN